MVEPGQRRQQARSDLGKEKVDYVLIPSHSDDLRFQQLRSLSSKPLLKQSTDAALLQGEVWQEEIDCPKQLDDVHMAFTVALTPYIVDQVPQAVVCLLWCYLQTHKTPELKAAICFNDKCRGYCQGVLKCMLHTYRPGLSEFY